MNRIRFATLAVVAGLTVLAACGGSGGGDNADADADADVTSDAPTESADGPAQLARPAALSTLPEVELLAPGEEDAGVAPTFKWKAFDGAAAYRLSVMGPQKPIWSWTGEDTEVTLALRTDDRSEYAPGLEIVTGSWWSVSALGRDGSVLALSPYRAVSPGDAPETPEPPAFMSGVPIVVPDNDDDDDARESQGEACDIVTPEEVATVFGEVDDYGPSGFQMGDGSDCTFRRVNDGLAIDIELQPTTDDYRPEDWVWGEPEPVPGLGDESYINNDGLSIRISWTHGEQTATVVAYAGNEERLVELAKLIDSRM